MEYLSIPVIVIICYLSNNLFKELFKGKKSLLKILPTLISLEGGFIGILIYLTNKEILFNVNNIWEGLGIGLVSGLTATGGKKILNKLKKERKI